MAEPRSGGVKTLAIRLPDELHAQLTLIAQLDGVSLTDATRQAIERLIERKRAPRQPLPEGGAADLADLGTIGIGESAQVTQQGATTRCCRDGHSSMPCVHGSRTSAHSVLLRLARRSHDGSPHARR